MKFANIRDYIHYLLRFGMFIISSLILLVVVILLTVYLIAYFSDEVTAEISGRSDVDFRVFYVENPVFDKNPISQNLHFFMSFTDRIEIDSSFSMELSVEADIYYNYTATERLVVRYMATIDGNQNPVTFEETRLLSEISGNTTGTHINLPLNTYTIYPHAHIYRYLGIAGDKRRLMDEQGWRAVGFRGLSAELFIDFVYTVHIPYFDISHRIIRGYRMALSTEVYSMVATGIPTFSESVNITFRALPFELTMQVVIAFVAALLLSGFCFFVGVKHLGLDANKQRQKAKDILRKYNNEIVTSNAPLPLSSYTRIPIDEFTELLKLAINRSEHIMCYHNTTQAEFAVVINEYAYCYFIDYAIGDD